MTVDFRFDDKKLTMHVSLGDEVSMMRKGHREVLGQSIIVKLQQMLDQAYPNIARSEMSSDSRIE